MDKNNEVLKLFEVWISIAHPEINFDMLIDEFDSFYSFIEKIEKRIEEYSIAEKNGTLDSYKKKYQIFINEYLSNNFQPLELLQSK